MRLVDRIFSILLILGGIGHSLGSWEAFHSNQMELLWAWTASLFVFLLAAVNLVRASRPGDSTLGWICLVAGLAWIGASLRFGQLVGNIFDIHAVVFAIITLVLCGFSLRTALHAKP